MRASMPRAAIALAFALAPVLAAQTPYYSYSYGIWGYSVAGAPSYLPELVVNGRDLGAGPLSAPRDMCFSPSGELYVLDSGNKRVVVLDGEFRLRRTISDFRDVSGERVELKDPRGIFVDAKGRIYLADRGAQAVRVTDPSGRVLFSLLKPKSDLVPENQEYYPEKVITDSSGVIYVLSFGFYQGAICFDEDGKFLGFFGSNQVTVTGKLRSDRFWRLFLTKAQKDKMTRYVPTEYVNFDIDAEDFVYTVSDFGDDSQRGQAKKLNPLSKNILFWNRKPDLRYFGDWEQYYNNSASRLEKSRFSDIAVDEEGFISLLDKTRGRVFMYDQDSNAIAIFGGPGDQEGSFRSPVAIETIGDRVIVLDEEKNSLTVFRPTRFGVLAREATVLYRRGDYAEALRPWDEVLRMDANYDLAYRGEGKAFKQLGRYAESAEAFKIAQYQGFYSESYKELRNQVLRDNFGLFALLLVLAVAVPLGFSWRREWILKRHPERLRAVKDVSAARFPFYLLLHPIKGYEELKSEGKGSLKAANAIMAAVFLARVANFLFTGFIFNGNKLDEINILMDFASTAGLAFLWTMANWGICTLQDGKGSFKEIWIFTSYALLSYAVLSLPLILVSNVLVRDEGIFLGIASWIMQGWVLISLVSAMKAVHQFTLKQALISMFLTVLGILLVLIVFALLYTLIAQFVSFGITIYQEILLRL
jgi:tetratricopeptide (TPR) repeat protein